MLETSPSRGDSDSVFTIVIARTLIHIVKAERLGYDDYWIYLAYLFLCTNAALQTVQTPYIYHLVRVRAGLEPAGERFLENGNDYLRYEFAIIGLFWSTLWTVSAHALEQTTLKCRNICLVSERQTPIANSVS